ncbi:MAG: acetate/propionate family kinase [Candidatus Moranbacteria bacterium]|nr:acetate/propionate family kinase [Candidatus Moranbacteria bacterium]
MYILSINSGSQTLKYRLFNAELKLIKKGGVDKIGFGKIKNHHQAFELCVDEISDYKEKISVIGHRYVNGGRKFINPTVMKKKEVKEIKKLNSLAPLHNPHNLQGIVAAGRILPKAVNVAVFDTCYYKELEEYVYRYPINKELADKYGYRKFGFHGISHKYVCHQAAELLKKDIKKLKLISVHLGGGASITATKFGRAVDTSMGFTPLEGLMMMTRSGDVDPGMLLDLAGQKKWKVSRINELLNYKSGIYGICGKKGMLDVLENLDKNKTALAFKMYIYRIKKYIGAYFAALNGCHAIVFTGSVGSGKAKTRNEVLKNMDFLKNVKILPIKTNEEYLIAKEALEVFENL